MINRHKDRSPKATISKIRMILADAGIITREHWFEERDGIYSVRVEEIHSGGGTNGKGATAELALASALAEFLERLQNFYIRATNMMINEAAWNSYDDLPFVFWPDEKNYADMNFARNNPLVLKCAAALDMTVEEVLARLGKTESSNRAGKIFAIPYKSLDEESELMMPVKLSYLCGGSNGMCAGNSKYEALTQGLSEVFERYAAAKIYYDELTPPVISREELAGYPELLETIDLVEKESNTTIELRDFSLGKQLPVVAVVAYSKNGKAFVNPGSHPEFAVAVERCLSELLQGKRLDKLETWFSEINFGKKAGSADFEAGWLNLMSNGKGVYPAAFYLGEPAWQYTRWPERAGMSNEELYKDSCSLLKMQGYTAYYRDVSFTGFNVYKIIAPGMAGYALHSPEYLKQILLDRRNGLRKALNDKKTTDAELVEWYKTLAWRSFLNDEPELLEGFPDKEVGAAIAVYLGDHESAAKLLDDLKGFSKKNFANYFKAAAQYLLLMRQEKNSGKVTNVLKKLYAEDTVKEVEQNYGKREDVFTQFEKMPPDKSQKSKATNEKVRINNWLRIKAAEYYLNA